LLGIASGQTGVQGSLMEPTAVLLGVGRSAGHVSRNKNHHFVPQFYLRNFGAGNSIALFNLDEKRHVPEASIPGQCKRPHLYGRDMDVEQALGDIEGHAAKVIADILARKTLPTPGSEAHAALSAFLLFLERRTPAAGAQVEADMTATFRAAFRDRSLEMKCESPVLFNLGLVAKQIPAILDLAAKVLVNSTDMAFITSDSPVVRFNQWCQGVHDVGCTGLASRGLQVFLPVSPRDVFVLYDPSVYRVGTESSSVVDVWNVRDVVGLNGLQLLTAENNLYYSPGQAGSKPIESLPIRWRSCRVECARTHRAISEDQTSELIHTYRPLPLINLSVSFMHVLRAVANVPLNDRAQELRKSAMPAFDAITKSLGDPDSRSPRVRRWRVVED